MPKVGFGTRFRWARCTWPSESNVWLRRICYLTKLHGYGCQQPCCYYWYTYAYVQHVSLYHLSCNNRWNRIIESGLPIDSLLLFDAKVNLRMGQATKPGFKTNTIQLYVPLRRNSIKSTLTMRGRQRPELCIYPSQLGHRVCHP